MIHTNIYSILIQIILSRSLANHLENISHHTINRYLKIENFDDQDLWRNFKEEIVTNTKSYLIFDDTVLNSEQ
ncbi:MAG: hypothetical protein F6K40_12920 [Okeania sp. SIO3I5]|uniref:hypothetical protein n=1 Tax=Okeania sp. SIO3I5 TaxID=2607805 RepID=UPI0013BBBAA0|nr:hypothetical protein [Okeania sp. SIO3I5]NEQ37116.1 hypothetical protein [Okeania sp. SIO3I5]